MFAQILLFLSLGLDTLAVAIGLGLAGVPRRRWATVGLTFALFEGLMPALGLGIGVHLSRAAGAWADDAAAAALILVGVLAIRESRCEADEDDDDDNADQADDKVQAVAGPRLLLTALSVSLDELAVGFSLGVLHVALGLALIYIAAQALLVTYAGLAFGRRLGARLEERAELASGVALTLLGIILILVRLFRHSFFNLPAGL